MLCLLRLFFRPLIYVAPSQRSLQKQVNIRSSLMTETFCSRLTDLGKMAVGTSIYGEEIPEAKTSV